MSFGKSPCRLYDLPVLRHSCRTSAVTQFLIPSGDTILAEEQANLGVLAVCVWKQNYLSCNWGGLAEGMNFGVWPTSGSMKRTAA